MTDKILGWPEPTEYGGHRVKRSNGDLNDRRATFTCIDCGTSEEGGVDWFGVGLDGCPARPESLDYLSSWRLDPSPPEDPAKNAREHWLHMARRVGLPVRIGEHACDPDAVGSFTPVYGDPVVCARFDFDGKLYELRYNQPGREGNYHIHAVKIEE